MSENECTCATQSDELFDYEPLDAVLVEYAREHGGTIGGMGNGSARSALIPILQATQNAYGYLPKEALVLIAKQLKMPLSGVYGVATFYTQFHLEPRGEHIVRICHGTACHVRGADEVTSAIEDVLGVKVGSTAEDLSFTVESVACVGCCGLAPVVLVDDTPHGGLDALSARRLASGWKREQRA